MKILIIDDEADIGFVLGLELNSLGHETVSFSSVSDALEFLHKENPDAIICDFQMPKMNGLELFESLKSQNKQIPFYLLTGEPTMDTQSLLDCGIADILFKPQDLLRLSSIFK
jgi:DNA-binding NtrC family response regulator